VLLLLAPLQSYSFNYMGQKLAQRVRVLMLGALLRQVRTFKQHCCACLQPAPAALRQLSSHLFRLAALLPACMSSATHPSPLCDFAKLLCLFFLLPCLLDACRRLAGTTRTATAAAC
jgi:hypothetical protein